MAMGFAINSLSDSRLPAELRLKLMAAKSRQIVPLPAKIEECNPAEGNGDGSHHGSTSVASLVAPCERASRPNLW